MSDAEMLAQDYFVQCRKLTLSVPLHFPNDKYKKLGVTPLSF